MLKEFLEFLKKYQVIGLAMAVVIGGKASSVVSAVVDQIVMPLVGLITPQGDWRVWAVPVGASEMKLGLVLGALLDFAIVAVLVFAFAKLVLREAQVEKR